MSGHSEVPEQAAPPVVAQFDAILEPHRSLGPLGFFLLMGAVALVGFAAGLTWLLLGAWPVTGWFGLELVLFYAMFRLNYRSARMFERVQLTAGRLIVERHDVGGKVRRWSFQPYWLRVTMDDPPQPDSPLMLSSHGETLAIGSFLSAGERLALATALRRALQLQRTTPAD